MNGQHKEKQISISCLLWKMVYQWRRILLIAVLFAVLFGALQYARDSKNSVTANDTKNVSLQDIKAGLTEKESTAVEQAQEMKKNLENKQDYKSNSILMNINPYEKNTVTLQYFADTNYSVDLDSIIPKDHTSDVVTAYISYIASEGYLSTLDMKDTSGIGELVNAQAASTRGDGVFSVIVVGKDADSAKDLADKIDAAIQAYQPTVSEKIGTNTLTLIDRYESIVSDDPLASSQVTMNNSILDLQTKLDTLTAAFSPEQIQVYNNKVTTSTVVVASKPSLSVKYVIFGALIGIFLYIAWIVVIYILDGKIKSAKELQDSYSLRVFGSVKQMDGQKKHILEPVDRWIDTIRYKGERSFEEQKKLIESKIIAICKKENIQKLFMTSSLVMDDKDCKIIEEVMKELKAFDIEVTFGDNNNYNVETVRKMTEIQNIVIIEKIEKSKYDALEREITLCMEQKLEVLGIFVIE